MQFNKAVKKLLLASATAVLLQACSSNDGEDPALLPAPLPVLAEDAIKADLAWSERVGDGVEAFFSTLTPSVAYGKVFVASRGGDVYAYDQDTGERIWSTDVRLEPNGFWQLFWFDDLKTARVAGGITASYKTIFFGTENGEVLALDEATGEIKWRSQVKGEVLAAPAVDSGKVFVQVSSGLVYALDARSGEEVWQTESEVPALTIRGNSAPVFANGGVMVGGSNGKLAVYLAETGQLAWEEAVAKPTGSSELERVVDIDVTPVIISPLIYSLSYGGTLTAMDLRNGRLVWKREYAGYVDMTSTGNDLIVIDNKSNIYAIDRRNGVEKWSNSQLLNRELTAPSVHNQRIVVGDFEGYLHWLNADSGEVEAQYEVDSDGLYSPSVIDNGRLFSQSRSGRLVAIDLP